MGEWFQKPRLHRFALRVFSSLQQHWRHRDGHPLLETLWPNGFWGRRGEAWRKRILFNIQPLPEKIPFEAPKHTENYPKTHSEEVFGCSGSFVIVQTYRNTTWSFSKIAITRQQPLIFHLEWNVYVIWLMVILWFHVKFQGVIRLFLTDNKWQTYEWLFRYRSHKWSR